jgi:hypothetical protein
VQVFDGGIGFFTINNFIKNLEVSLFTSGPRLIARSETTKQSEFYNEMATLPSVARHDGIMFRLLSERITQIEAGWTKPLRATDYGISNDFIF